MRILDVKPNISEKMRIMPISNDEFNSIKPMHPKDILKSGDIVIVRNDFNYYVFLTFEDFKKYKIDKKIFSKTKNIDDRQDLLEKTKEGIFVSAHRNGIDMRTVCFGWMGLSSYDDNLEMKNGHSDYDVTFAYRPNTLLDLENTESYHKSYLNKEINSQKGRILFGKTKNIKQNIFEKMKIIPISNDEFDKVSEYNDTLKSTIKTGDIVHINNYYYVFFTTQDFLKNNICKKYFHTQNIHLLQKAKNGIFVVKNTDSSLGYMGLDSYDGNLKMLNGNHQFDITLVFRPKTILDLSKLETFDTENLSKEVNSHNGTILFAKFTENNNNSFSENMIDISKLANGIYDGYWYDWIFELADGTKYKTNFGVRRSKRMTSLKKYKVTNGQIYEL